MVNFWKLPAIEMAWNRKFGPSVFSLKSYYFCNLRSNGETNN